MILIWIVIALVALVVLVPFVIWATWQMWLVAGFIIAIPISVLVLLVIGAVVLGTVGGTISAWAPGSKADKAIRRWLDAPGWTSKSQKTHPSASRRHVSRKSLVMSSFYVYDNHPNNYAAVHLGDCPHCKHGKGQRGGGSTNNGEWLGPFESRGAAEVAAVRTGKRDAQWCGHCARRLGVSPLRIGNIPS